MSAVLLIGPSKAGKTSLAKKLAKTIPNCKHLDMDLKAKVREPGYIQRAQEIIKKCIDKKDYIYILDFGAGFQNTKESYNLFSPYSDIMVTILNSPDTVYSRHPGRDKNEFLKTEFRKERQQIYQLSKYRIEVNSDFNNAERRLYKIVWGITGQQKN
jgi:shikimate kinase